MSPIQWVLTVITYVVLFLLVWKGRGPERLAGVALLMAQVGTPLIAHITVNGVRLGVAALSLMLTLSLIFLALTGRRWWLIAAAGVQLIALASWGYQIIDPQAQIWGALSFRMVVWVELMALAVFGLFEARMAPYARRVA
jgi:hypothetical protein